jgi:hypothetical protein
MRSRRFTRLTLAALAGGGVVLIVLVLVWFQPQKLLLDTSVHEALPGAQSGGPGRADVRVVAGGSFSGLEHETSGRALLLELSDGSRFVRFEDLETSNGPDLRVYLSPLPAGRDLRAYGEGSIDLGGLKANTGNQNYAIPDDVDPAVYESAVIWCRRFTVGFGVAPLHAVPPSSGARSLATPQSP